MLTPVKLNILLLSVFISFATTANTCPNELVVSDVQILNPRTKELIKFECLNETRREFIKFVGPIEENKKLVATVYKNLDSESGKEKLTLNTLNIVKNDLVIHVEKFDQTGKLERFEKYQNQKIIFKYVEKAQRLEEFQINPNNETKLIRECYYDFDANHLHENIFKDLQLQIKLEIIDSNEKNITAREDIILIDGKNKIELKNEDGRIIPIQFFNIEYCISKNFFPTKIQGMVGYLNKNYILLDTGISGPDFIKLLEEKNQQGVIQLLETNSKEIKERIITPEIKPEENPTDNTDPDSTIDNDESNINSDESSSLGNDGETNTTVEMTPLPLES